MSYEISVKESYNKRTIPAKEMCLGEIGIIEDTSLSFGQEGEILLRDYSGLVSLSRPGRTWSDPLPSFDVRLFSPGTEIVLRIKKCRTNT